MNQVNHYNDVIMGAIASQITSFTIVYSTVYSGTDQRKHQSSASLAFVQGIHLWLVNSPHKWPVTRNMFPFDDITMMWLFFPFQWSSTVACVLVPLPTQACTVRWLRSPVTQLCVINMLPMIPAPWWMEDRTVGGVATQPVTLEETLPDSNVLVNIMLYIFVFIFIFFHIFSW